MNLLFRTGRFATGFARNLLLHLAKYIVSEVILLELFAQRLALVLPVREMLQRAQGSHQFSFAPGSPGFSVSCSLSSASSSDCLKKADNLVAVQTDLSIRRKANRGYLSPTRHQLRR